MLLELSLGAEGRKAEGHLDCSQFCSKGGSLGIWVQRRGVRLKGQPYGIKRGNQGNVKGES